MAIFLLTPLREGRPHALECLFRRALFLLTPLREGRRSCSRCCSSTDSHFYSRPCGRGDVCSSYHASRASCISTHAPAGGATLAWAACLCRVTFLLTPLREGRRTDVLFRRGMQDFYSRPCGRGDGCFLLPYYSSFPISTHAPAGGATRRYAFTAPPINYFYSRPCGRGDERRSRGLPCDWQFLLTPLREGRPSHTFLASICTSEFLLTPLREGRHTGAGSV